MASRESHELRNLCCNTTTFVGKSQKKKLVDLAVRPVLYFLQFCGLFTTAKYAS
jgi:hypothetical protein